MSNILIINCGSSSLKLTLFKEENGQLIRLADAHMKGMNTPKTSLSINANNKNQKFDFQKKMDIESALQETIKAIETCASISRNSLIAVGHRVVHGGEKYLAPTLITPKVLKELDQVKDLAPLHNDICIEAIKKSIDLFGKNIPQIAVFDTSFHHTIPSYASTYAIPLKLSKKLHIKRYGFHGISHAFLWETYANLIPSPPSQRVISLHLGSGCSITAIKNGKSIDTSMGFTPLEGLVMATRSGDLDPGIIEYLCNKEKFTAADVVDQLNNQSGLLGLSGYTSDMQVLMSDKDKKETAKLAIDVFCYRAIKYIGAYYAALSGVDAILFGGGIGENAQEIREQIIKGVEELGFHLDMERNREAVRLGEGEIKKISSDESKNGIYVVATDENLSIARQIGDSLSRI